MPQGRIRCPLCWTSHSSREILRHIRDKHTDVILSADQLCCLDAKQCRTCRKVLARGGQGRHACQLSIPQRPPVATGHRAEIRSRSVPAALVVGASTEIDGTTGQQNRTSSTSARAQPGTVRTVLPCRSSCRIAGPLFGYVTSELNSPTHSSLNPLFEPEDEIIRQVLQSTPRSVSPRLGEAGTSHQAPPTQEVPVQQPDARAKAQASQHIHYAAQTVPKGCKAAFSEIAAKALNRCVATAETGGAEHESAQQDLLLLLSRLLHQWLPQALSKGAG